jgi:hypothetical protein
VLFDDVESRLKHEGSEIGKAREKRSKMMVYDLMMNVRLKEWESNQG